jgi:hypothetical protein
MDVEVISKDKWLQLLNECIKKHPYYKNGMKVYKVPNTENPTGYSWDSKWDNDVLATIVSGCVSKLREKYAFLA